MKSIRLEQLDSYKTSFKSHVIARDDKSDELWVSLAESLFYPTSGGQIFDTGTLNDLTVLDVEKRDDLVWHKLSGTLNVGDEVEGQLDWARRFKHMQRHSGQHLVSQALVRLNPAFETKSVSLTSETCTVDFAANPQEADLEAAQTLVNDIAYKNLPITAFEIDDTDLAKYPLRRPPKVKGRIRLVQIGDWELSACGGTHLRSTAEAAPIKFLRFERVRGDLTRLYFKVGLEALNDYSLKHNVAYELAQGFSARVPQVPERVEALKEELRVNKLALLSSQKDLARYLAKDLVQQATETPQGSVVIHVLQENEQALLQPLAQELVRQDNVIALLAVQLSERINFLFGRSANLQADMNALLKKALPFVEGRGGGKPDRAQGGGAKTSGLQEALDKAKAELH